MNPYCFQERNPLLQSGNSRLGRLLELSHALLAAVPGCHRAQQGAAKLPQRPEAGLGAGAESVGA